MKFYQVLLLVLCISISLSILNPGCGDAPNDSKDKCNGKLTDDQKNKGYTHCCFYRYKAEKQDEVKNCMAINQYQFDHISDFLTKGQMWTYGTDDYNFECSSTYFKLSLLSLILILL